MDIFVIRYLTSKYRHIQSAGDGPLGWEWSKKEVIRSMAGAQAQAGGLFKVQRKCSPLLCLRKPFVVDFLPGTPYNQQGCQFFAKGSDNFMDRDRDNAISSFQISVGSAGTTNKTVRAPKHFTLKVPGPGYT
ncbi:hypothetical protein IFM89_010897 [Coptis chinensis]|uniref:Uncharacterized protein n=1 Tax=Coptis chinensis TaxID=261450 RepID=A0A835IPW7_9MAGN|nr:hypothetical protein IFM89_010897 [Coptis chinensis]